MNQLRKQQRAFAERYFGGEPQRVAKQHAANIRTIVIDTPSLTDGSILFDRSVHFGVTNHNVLSYAKKALVGQDTPVSRAINGQVSQSSDNHSPVRSVAGNVTGSVWHHGETYKSYWVGKPTSVAHGADLTENERESFLMTARKLAAHGSKVYAVAYSEHTAEPASYQESRSEIIGLLVFHPLLYPGTEQAVAAIQANNIDIIYASEDSEHEVRVFSYTSCLAPSASVTVQRPGRELSLDDTLYASLDTLTKRKIISHYPKESRLVVPEPLVEFWRTFSTFFD